MNQFTQLRMEELTSARPSPGFWPHYESEQTGQTTPNLGRSLEEFEKMGSIGLYLSRLDPNPRCLIEGYSSSVNAQALHNFFRKYGIKNPEIYAVDIDDTGFRVARKKGLDDYIKEFKKINAARIDFPDGYFDVIAQDFLLNCACLELHKSIIEEAVRLLRPSGIAMIGTTSCEGLENTNITRVDRKIIENKYGITLNGVLSVKGRLKEDLSGKAINCKEGFILCTKTGDLEFFRTRGDFENLLYEHFTPIEFVSEIGVDRNNMECHRRREILIKKVRL